MAIYYVDYTNGNDSWSGNTFNLASTGVSAGPWKTISHSLVAGDAVRIAKSTDATLVDTGVWTNNSKQVTLSGIKISGLYSDGTWFVSGISNVTASTSTTRKQGTNSASLAVGAGFANTGKIGFYDLSAAKDLSAYQQLSFWMRQNVTGPMGMGIRLCTDPSGNTPLNDFRFYVYSNGDWNSITLTSGTNLGSAVRSIGLYRESGAGAVTFLIDNIMACKDSNSPDSINLNSLISKNSAPSGADYSWYPIQSITTSGGNTLALIDNDVTELGTAGKGYYGTTSTSLTYKRETIPTQPATTTTTIHHIQSSGNSETNLIEYLGGYNTGNTGQDGYSFFNGANGQGYCFNFSGKGYVKISKIGTYRYAEAIRGQTEHAVLNDIFCGGNTTNGLNITTSAPLLKISGFHNVNNGSLGAELVAVSRGDFQNIFSSNNNGVGWYMDTSCSDNTFNCIECNNNTNNGLQILATQNNKFVGSNQFKGNTVNGIRFGEGATDNHFYNVVLSGNSTSSVDNVSSSRTWNYFYDSVFAESTEVTFDAGTIADFNNNKVFSERHDNADNNHVHFHKLYRIETDTGNKVDGSNYSWKLSPTSRTLTTGNPVIMKFGKYWGNSGNAPTLTVSFKRNSFTGNYIKVINYGGILGLLTTEATGTSTGFATATLSFGTLTKNGVLEPDIQCWGNSTESAWVDNDFGAFSI